MQDLRQHLERLGPRVLHISDEVDPISQAGVLCSEARTTLLLDNLKGFPGWRLVDILVATRELQAAALNTTPDNVAAFLSRRIFSAAPKKARIVDHGACKDVVLTGPKADIRKLPIPIHSYGDAGRYLGSGLTVTKDPDTGIKNVAVIRTMLHDDDPRRAGFFMVARHNWAHYMKYSERDEPMPMAYVIGMHPAYDIAANFSGPHEDFDEFELGASLIDDDLAMVPCETIDLEVPAAAEVVIEGIVHPHVREHEGPFGEFTGYKGGVDGPAPVFEVTAITHRHDPIFRHMQATVVTDHQPLVALPMEATLYRRCQEVHGGTSPIHDVHVPAYGGLFTSIFKVTPQWDGTARDIGLSALTGPNIHTKIAIVVDDDVDIHNMNDVLWAISTRVDPAKDVIVIPRERIHPLDLTGSFVGDETVMRVGGKMVIDATKPAAWRKEEREEFRRVQPMGTRDRSLDSVLEKVRSFKG